MNPILNALKLVYEFDFLEENSIILCFISRLNLLGIYKIKMKSNELECLEC